MSWETVPVEEEGIFFEAYRTTDELYNVRDTFFPLNPLDKFTKMRQLSSSALTLLDSIPTENRKLPMQRATYEYLRGKILDASPEYNKEAEEHLTKAVKLNPSLADAWLSLGNCIWKKGELVTAMNCLKLALKKGPHKKILCLLSMLERKVSQDVESIEYVEESIKHAREAVSLDVKDGYSWYNLGNAFLTSFFMTLRLNLSPLLQAMKAYQNAERDERMQSNPDLYFNSATTHKYLENYERALSGFQAAALKDPGLSAAAEVERIVKLVDGVDRLLHVYANSKRLASIAASINTVQVNPSYRNSSIDTLQEGDNRAVAIIGKVLNRVLHESATPEYYILCDPNQICYVLTVYGTVIDMGDDSKHILQDDQVMVLDPHYRRVDFSWKGKSYKFRSVRVDQVKQLLVNGMSLKLTRNAATPLRALHKP
ncbi:hypothetical protein Leryth_018939 [Lithospermum erythrorhizon]|nr:hypothetical protein Leryth_018939 [Lithospermum erythrorhizon]